MNLKTNKIMSITAELERMALEYFGEGDFNSLRKLEQEIVITLFSLDNIVVNPTDLSKNESDNIRETKNI
jgi:hypothetical protein